MYFILSAFICGAIFQANFYKLNSEIVLQLSNVIKQEGERKCADEEGRSEVSSTIDQREYDTCIWYF